MLQKLINIIKTKLSELPDNFQGTSNSAVIKGNPIKRKSFKKINTVTKPLVFDKKERADTILEKLYLFANGMPPKNWSPSRFIYKVGLLKIEGAIPYLSRIIEEESDLLKEESFRYSLIWALGRCGGVANLPLLDKITKRKETDYIKRLSLDIYLKLAPASIKETITKELTALLPNGIIDILKTTPFENLSNEALKQLFPEDAKNPLSPLFIVYLLAQEAQELRPILLNLIKELPLKYPYFKGLRYIFKSAEFREDYEFLGLLAYRFDSVNGSYTAGYRWKRNTKTQRWVRTKEHRSNAAFSTQSKGYFQKRIARNLTLLGEQETIDLCDYAAAILQHYQDNETQGKEDVIWKYTYNRETRRHISTKTVYQVYNTIIFPWLSMSNLNEHLRIDWKSSKYRLKEGVFQNNGSNSSIPFSELWQKNPSAACRLLQYCRSEAVAEFALKTLKGHSQENALITKEVILQLLQSPLTITANYTLTQIQRFFTPTKPDWAFITTMIQSPNEIIRKHILTALQEHSTVYFNEAQLVALTALSLKADIAKWFQENAAQFSINASEKARIFQQLLTTISDLKTAEDAQILYQNSQAFFHTEFNQIAIEKATLLLQHSLENVQLLGASILTAQKENIENIPEALILSMLEASYPSIRAKGMELFGALPIALLLKKKDILVSMAISKEPEIREAIKPILARTAEGKPEWSAQLLQFFIPLLLQKETYEGLHGDLLELVVDYLGTALPSLPSAMMWKLIQSNYKDANLLGMELLQYLDFSKESLTNIITIGNHEMPTIRQYCFDYFNKNIGRVRYESVEALRLLDAKWEDSRQFGFDFFEKHYKAGDWTPELLVSTCDSTRPDVQEFGKKMITKFFDKGKGEDYLLQLSQHPSVSLQLFATNYLEEFAAGNTANIIQLKYYFKTVLCSLCKGGETKKRIFNFLEAEALKSEEVATHIIEIINEVSLTIGIRDKARCIQILFSIKRAYPELASVLEIAPVS